MARFPLTRGFARRKERALFDIIGGEKAGWYKQAETSNMRWRPVGLGVMGLQDVFFQLGLPNALKLALDHAGFAESTEFRIDKPLNFAGEREVLAAMFAGGPVALAYSKFSPEVKDAVHSEFLASVASYRNGAGFDIPGEFVFMLGRKAG